MQTFDSKPKQHYKPIIGYKKLIPQIEYGKFISPAYHADWNNFTLTANRVPESGELFGINAYFESTNPDLNNYTGIIVELELWGKIVVGEVGCRAEHARIVGFDILQWMNYLDCFGVFDCEHCEEEFPKSEGVKTDSGIWYCEECSCDLVYNCGICGIKFDENEGTELDHYEDWICEDCSSKYEFHCPVCNSQLIVDDEYDLYNIVSPDSGNSYHATWYCDDCIWEDWDSCYKCGEYYERNYSPLIEFEDEYLCEYCIENVAWKCEDCEEWYPIQHDKEKCDKDYCRGQGMYKCSGLIRENESKSDSGICKDCEESYCPICGNGEEGEDEYCEKCAYWIQFYPHPYLLKHSDKQLAFPDILHWGIMRGINQNE